MDTFRKKLRNIRSFFPASAHHCPHKPLILIGVVYSCLPNASLYHSQFGNLINEASAPHCAQLRVLTRHSAPYYGPAQNPSTPSYSWHSQLPDHIIGDVSRTLLDNETNDDADHSIINARSQIVSPCKSTEKEINSE